MIYGPKNDGTYIVEFKAAGGEALAIPHHRQDVWTARRRSFGNGGRSLTGAPSKFPILERASNIQQTSSLRPASLKKVLDSGSSAPTDALSYPFTLVPTRPAKIPRPT
jgi:hypothetical protein